MRDCSALDRCSGSAVGPQEEEEEGRSNSLMEGDIAEKVLVAGVAVIEAEVGGMMVVVDQP